MWKDFQKISVPSESVAVVVIVTLEHFAGLQYCKFYLRLLSRLVAILHYLQLFGEYFYCKFVGVKKQRCDKHTLQPNYQSGIWLFYLLKLLASKVIFVFNC